MIRKFKAGDINAINELGLALEPNFKRLFNIADLTPYERIYVYDDNDEILGFLHILINYEVLEILNLIVEPTHQRQGIASLLLDHLLSEPGLNYQRIILEVRAGNKAALKLYNKFNFLTINTRKKYYGAEDAIIMERSNN